ncbi:MAG: N-acetyltransferase family protein, partial [Rhodoglobus sp.]|nr:N-acetyltransferase family protein [Rhodoglobus sp.]
MLEEEYQPRRRLPSHLRPAPTPEAPFDYVMRDAVAQDLPYVREIYNHYVLNSTVTFDEKPMTLAELKRKFAKTQDKKMPFLVAENPAGQLLGYAYVYPWKEKAAYRFTVENSIYLGPASTGKGLGKAMLAELIERSRAAGLKARIADIADRGADASIEMHTNF